MLTRVSLLLVGLHKIRVDLLIIILKHEFINILLSMVCNLMLSNGLQDSAIIFFSFFSFFKIKNDQNKDNLTGKIN